MSNSAGAPIMNEQEMNEQGMEPIGKGKGKVAEEMPVDDDDDEEGTEGEGDGENEEVEEDHMEEIDEGNVLTKRTRGKNIDFAQAAKDLGDDEDDEDEDDDFEDPDADKMEE